MYLYEGKLIKSFFADPKAKLPVKLKTGIKHYHWGRRQGQHGNLPIGGTATLESLENSLWDPYFPIHVKLPIAEFWQLNTGTAAGNWYSLTNAQFIHGMIASEGDEHRVYIVTIKPTTWPDYSHWPRIINS
jgi:hypothetical protein